MIRRIKRLFSRRSPEEKRKEAEKAKLRATLIAVSVGRSTYGFGALS